MSDAGINSVIAGISAALNMEFGEEYTIYSEAVKQGFKEPCFFITALEPSNNRFLGNRFFRRQPFCVQYFPKSGSQPSAECLDTAERLYELLDIITAGGDPIRGTRMSHKITDGVLSFFVNYDYFTIRRTDDDNKMERLSSDVSAKGKVNYEQDQ